MFVPDDIFLVGYDDLNICIFIKDNTLTSQPGFDLGIDGPFYKVFFLIRYFFQIITTFSAGLSVTSTQPDAVGALLTFLVSPGVANIKRDNGMEPG